MSSTMNRLAISTMSLGRAWHHKLAPKLAAAASHSYSGIELFFEDLEYHARDLFSGNEPHQLLQAAAHVRDLCAQLHLSIICLQPLMHFEGLLDPAARTDAFCKARLWFRIANILQTDIVAVPSNFLGASQTTGDMSVLVRDLRELADVATEYGVRLVYEALCWGVHVDRWEQSWEIVTRVDRSNFGICLDTFNIAGRICADPTAANGWTSDAQAALAASLEFMAGSVDVKKVFYIQVVDAEKLASPLDEAHEFYDASQPARMSWSRNCRLFYGEQSRGAYLPIEQILRTIFDDVGFQGWVSMELFNRSMADPGPTTPIQHAERGAVAWKKMQSDFSFGAGTESAVATDFDEKRRPRAVL